jgi:hypothetical protein
MQLSTDQQRNGRKAQVLSRIRALPLSTCRLRIWLQTLETDVFGGLSLATGSGLASWTKLTAGQRLPKLSCESVQCSAVGELSGVHRLEENARVGVRRVTTHVRSVLPSPK